MVLPKELQEFPDPGVVGILPLGCVMQVIKVELFHVPYRQALKGPYAHGVNADTETADTVLIHSDGRRSPSFAGLYPEETVHHRTAPVRQALINSFPEYEAGIQTERFFSVQLCHQT